MANDAYIISAHRSPVMPKGGAFFDLEIHQLAAPVIQACIETAQFDRNGIDELILSNAVGGGGNPPVWRHLRLACQKGSAE